ncbi:hypothetical protein [Nocardioides daphniae]|uniref:Uncharacterized protein n=1 Tax=Nocardioides daphniae TaxID=402297 RepID=A0A4P7UCI1_9ACTN|nr:hypothetical protein [Nocardioides daphniae]QCC77736.1 hypothetical protein E2C04_12085 [Nocardioides daphniae]GGD28914.1 hypothetical protein GCM10007231_30550 [Nocardioides daphniae]
MTTATVRAWLVEALTDRAPTSPLDVARAVWLRHESDLRSGGDLVLTWQLDLHAAAAAMVAEGTLVVDADGRWLLVGTPAPGRGQGPWSDEEIAVAVAAYVALLRAEHAGRPLHRSGVVADVLARTGRTPPQLDAMMANVSAVVQEHGYVPLSTFPPRSNVPRGVRPAVAAALAQE